MKEHLADVLDAYIQRESRKISDLARLTGIARRTIVSWLDGVVKKPRNPADLLKVANALHLTFEETNRLLKSGQQHPISDLFTQATEENNKELFDALKPWDVSPPFQVPRLKKLVNRDNEFAQIQKYLSQKGIICLLCGMGGVGKTSLAINIAYATQADYPDGVLWAELDTSNAMTILGTFAAAYGRKVSQYGDLASRSQDVRQFLARKNALIILDNAQNIEEIKSLLPSTGKCSVLITTQNKHLLTGHVDHDQIHIAPFNENHSLSLLEEIMGKDQLQAELAGFKKLISILGGLPLALQLAGHMLKGSEFVTATEYANILEEQTLHRLGRTVGNEALLHTCFEISYKQLSKSLRELFESLSTFDGANFSLSAIVFVCEKDAGSIQLDMASLASVFLVEASPIPQPHDFDRYLTIRFRLHPLIRVYAREKAAHDLNTYRLRALNYFTNFAKVYVQNFDALDLEWDNISGALDWAQQEHKLELLTQTILALTDIHLGIAGYLDARGYWQRAQEILQFIISSTKFEENSSQIAKLYSRLGAFLVRLANYENAQGALNQSLQMFQTFPQDEETVYDLANVYLFFARLDSQRNPQKALDWIEAGIGILTNIEGERSQEQQGVLLVLKSSILGQTGQMVSAIDTAVKGIEFLPEKISSAHITGYITLINVHAMLGNHEQSMDYLETGLSATKIVRDIRQQAILWMNRGILMEWQGRLSAARENHQKALPLFEQIGDINELGSTHLNLGLVFLKLGEFPSAQRELETAVSMSLEYGIVNLTAYAQTGLANLLIYQDELLRAQTLLAQAEAHCRQIDITSLLPLVHYWQATANLKNKEPQKALELVNQAMSIAENNQQPLEQGMLYRLFGEISVVLSNLDQAQKAFLESIKILEEQDPYELGISYRTFAQFLITSKPNHQEEIESNLNRSYDIFKKLGAQNELNLTKTIK